MQEHHAPWEVPVSSHKLQGVREKGTETTEVRTQHDLRVVRGLTFLTLSIFTQFLYELFQEHRWDSLLWKNVIASAIETILGQTFWFSYSVLQNLGGQKKRLWLTTGPRKCSLYSQCYILCEEMCVYTLQGYTHSVVAILSECNCLAKGVVAE